MSEPAANDQVLAAGTLVGSYRIERPLGSGGMGAVYAGIEPTIGKRVAVKVLRRALADDPQWLARFEREARAVNEISHPGIVDVFAFGKLDDGRPYLVMSLLDGESLREALAARRALAPKEAWRITRTVAEALLAAHARGIVHRDLKPDNIFLEAVSGREPTPRVLDFGIAKVAVPDAEKGKLTESGVVMGTPAYMAPEQWWGRDVDGRADQYALGCVLFHMLTGAPPFGSEGFVELLQRHLNETPPTLAERGAALGDGPEALISKALAKSRGDRFASLAAFIEAGDRAFEGSQPEAPVATPTAVGVDTKFVEAPTIASVPAVTPSKPITTLRTSFVFANPALRRRFWQVHGALLLAGPVLLYGVGYAGAELRDVREWFHIGGFGTYGGLFWFAVAAVIIARSAKRRYIGSKPRFGPLMLALVPAIMALFSTTTGWIRARSAIATLDPAARLSTLFGARFEANANRFLGYTFSAVLCLSLAALPFLETPPMGSAKPPSRAALALLLASAAGLLLAVVTGNYAATLGLFAAAVVALLAFVAPLPTAAPVGLVLERALLSTLGTAMLVAVGFSRIEGRESALWQGHLTRAERVTEIVDAAAERLATTPLSLLALFGVIVFGITEVQASRLLHKNPPWPKQGSARAVVMAVSLMALTDIGWYALFSRDRAEIREALAGQFALFGELDPPPTDKLDPEQNKPHIAHALQVARTYVGIDGERIAKLTTLESDLGASNLARDLGRTLASAGETDGGIDLSVSIDGRVTMNRVARVLTIAHASGARRIELLFTRGAPPQIPLGAPAEASHLVVEDFVALRANLGATGLDPGGSGTFSETAPTWLAAAEGGQIDIAAAK